MLPRFVDEGLVARGHEYYTADEPVGRVARLVASFDTTTEDVDRLLADVRALLRRAR